jgi:NurA-like 5'-3' nuclease
MTENEIEELLESKSNITDQTRKNYTRIYNKIRAELNDDIRATNETKLIKTVLELSNDNPSVALTYINIPIMIKKFYNKDVTKLVDKQAELNKQRNEHTSNKLLVKNNDWL